MFFSLMPVAGSFQTFKDFEQVYLFMRDYNSAGEMLWQKGTIAYQYPNGHCTVIISEGDACNLANARTVVVPGNQLLREEAFKKSKSKTVPGEDATPSLWNQMFG